MDTSKNQIVTIKPEFCEIKGEDQVLKTYQFGVYKVQLCRYWVVGFTKYCLDVVECLDFPKMEVPVCDPIRFDSRPSDDEVERSFKKLNL